MHDIADFRSDTVTKPTPAMYEAMAKAPLGDDVLSGDPTLVKLEELGAQTLGKEAALFVPSGVMANQIAFKLHTNPGDEIICEARCHTYNKESGAIAFISNAQVRPIVSDSGMPALADVLRAIQTPNIHHARTRLVTVENTNNANGGRVLPQDDVDEMGRVLGDLGVAFHLDGARIANASVATGRAIAELAAPFDSVAMCLSKGLGSPVGSLIAGTTDFIAEARRLRKVLGGGMRQAGILGACGIVALESMIDRLSEDHDNCKRLARGLSEIEAIDLDLDAVETNIVFFSTPKRADRLEELRLELAERGVLALHMPPDRWRMVTHYDVDAEDVDKAIAAWRDVLKD